MDFIKPLFTMAVRHALGFLGGYLVSQGFITQEQNAQFVAGVLAVVVAVVWSVINKYMHKKAIDTALALPAGSTVEKLMSELRGM